MKHLLKFLGFGSLFGLLLISIPTLGSNFWLGMSFLALPLAFAAWHFFRVVFISRIATSFLLLGLGILEVWLGIVKGLPISWMILMCFVALAFMAKIASVIKGHFRDAFARDHSGKVTFSESDLRKIGGMYSPFAESFFEERKFGSMGGAASSKRGRRDHVQDEDDFESSRDLFEGPNPIISEDDPHGDTFR